MNEDDAIYWQDTLEAILAGRTSGLACPFCQKEALVITREARTTRVACSACKHFIEGRFGED